MLSLHALLLQPPHTHIHRQGIHPIPFIAFSLPRPAWLTFSSHPSPVALCQLPANLRKTTDSSFLHLFIHNIITTPNIVLLRQLPHPRSPTSTTRLRPLSITSRLARGHQSDHPPCPCAQRPICRLPAKTTSTSTLCLTSPSTMLSQTISHPLSLLPRPPSLPSPALSPLLSPRLQCLQRSSL